MRKRLNKTILLIFCFMLVALSLQAEGGAIPGLSRSTLDNGLEVFVYENHSVPLARVQITFRAGAIAQTAQTAGLFHLFEHMLFTSNQKYQSERDLTAALANLGVSEWNGGTSSEYVTYYFDIPSDKLDQGLEFWSWAMRTPTFDPAELEREKKVVTDEIAGDINDPAYIYQAAINKRFYSQYPYRRDVAGSPQNVAAATVDNLRAIQAKYYIPNNAALFIGGDVKPAEALALAKKWYGDWASGPDPWKTFPPAFSLPAVRRPTLLIYKDPRLPEGLGSIEMYYRGPDVTGNPKAITTDPAATYAADVWGTLVSNPDGKFMNDVMKNVPKLYDKKYLDAGYLTQRDGGQVRFSTIFVTDPELPAWARAQFYFKEQIHGAEAENMRRSTAKYFGPEEFEAVKTKLEDQRLAELETADGFISSLSFWWATASTDYFLNYIDKVKKVTPDNVSDFVTKYISHNLEILSLRLSPADYDREVKLAKDHGFEEITADNAFWWKK
jgi:zinc protease